jgi:hypothetical protein
MELSRAKEYCGDGVARRQLNVHSQENPFATPHRPTTSSIWRPTSGMNGSGLVSRQLRKACHRANFIARRPGFEISFFSQPGRAFVCSHYGARWNQDDAACLLTLHVKACFDNVNCTSHTETSHEQIKQDSGHSMCLLCALASGESGKRITLSTLIV